MEYPGGNVQQAVENVGLEKGTWVRAKDNMGESHPLSGNRKSRREMARKSWEETASLKKRRAEAQGQSLRE